MRKYTAAIAAAVLWGQLSSASAADTADPTVAIAAPAATAVVPVGGTTFSGTAADAGGISSVRIYVYDESRNAYTVSNAAAAYNATIQVWSFAVLASHITPGGFVRLWVQARDATGNSSDWQLRRLRVAAGTTPPPADTTAPAVVITAPSAAAPAASAGFVFSGTADDAGGISSVRIYVYDESRNAYTVSNAAAAYNAVAKTWSFSVTAAQITPGGFARLWVRAADAAGNSSVWQLRRVQVAASASAPDTSAPVVGITAPTPDALVDLSGTTFSGTAADAGGISSVRIYVYDESRNAYTVSNAAAAYNATIQVWSFAVLASHITPGGFVRLWVQARDATGNSSDWQLRRLRVGVTVESLGPSIAQIQGTRIMLQRRQMDGALSAARPLKLRGVAYSPVDAGETIDSRESARQHLRESGYAEDFAALQQMGANAVKLYVDAGTDAAAAAILNEAYLRGLMVAVTLDIDSAETQSVVNAYKNHPALLCWIIGNEWNLNRFFRGLSIEQATAEVEAFARQVRSLDANHPVGSSLGFLPGDYNMGRGVLLREFPGIITATPGVDFWGLNVYRSASFDPIFFEWSLLSPKPFMVTEFGTDDWDTENGRIDEAVQAETNTALWDELHRHLSANNASRQCLGGFVFAWNDEWWKFGNPPLQDHGGFVIEQTVFRQGTAVPIAVFRGHPDGVSNEEHYGLVTLARQPKAAFGAMQSAFTLGTLRTDAVNLTVASAGQAAGFAAFHKRGLPVSATEIPGLHLVVINRSTGTVDSMAHFNVAADAAAQCGAFSAAVDALPVGAVAMVAAARQALPAGVPLSHPSFSVCAAALGRLHSARALEVTPQSSWALIASVGPAPLGLNLAEALDVSGAPLSVSADIQLDVDGDGTADAQDADNDNDGKSDAMERAWRSDILDPAPYY